MEVPRFVAALCLSAVLVASAAAVRAATADDDDPGAASPVVGSSDSEAADPPSVTTSPTTAAPPATASTPEPQDVVSDYLQAIVEGRFPDAYRLLCVSTQSAVAEASFVDELAARRRSHAIRGFSINEVFGTTELGTGVGATVSFGADSNFTALLERDDTGAPWRICVINGGYAEVLTWPESLDPDGVRRE